MTSEISALLNSNSPMASPINGASDFGPPQPQISSGSAYGGAQAVQNAMAQHYAQPQYVPDDDDDMHVSSRKRMTTGGNFMNSLMDDADKRVTILVFAILVIAQHQQTRDMARSIAKSAGMQLAGSPYENVAISAVLAAAFYYVLINYF